MSDSEPHPDRSIPDLDSRRSSASREPIPPHPAASLRFVPVEYADRPDRCTVHPPDAEGVGLMSTWLSADREDFVDLADRR